MAETPYDKVKQANEDYHEALDEFMQNDAPVELKAEIGHIAHPLFTSMSNINSRLKAHYEPEEE